MNKNNIILVLVAAALLGSIWGSVVNRQKIDLEQQLKEARAELRKISEVTSKEHVRVLGKTAGIQESLAEKEDQLGKARKELVVLRKETQTLEAKLSGCNATVQDLTRKKEETLGQQLQLSQHAAAPDQDKSKATVAAQLPGTETTVAEPESELLPGQLQTADLTVERLQQRLAEANAQLIGLEKIVDEKNEFIQETSQEMDRLKINMEVLLAKIAEQQGDLRAIREENRELVKQLAAQDEEMADFQEELFQRPVKE